MLLTIALTTVMVLLLLLLLLLLLDSFWNRKNALQERYTTSLQS